MRLSDWIQFAGVIVALVIGIISIVISVNTLKQNSKMIEESTRPYIVVYHDIFNDGSAKGIFIVKNFGKTGAYITKFSCDQELKSLQNPNYSLKQKFSYLNDTFLAPGESKKFPIIRPEPTDHPITFLLSYQSGHKTYTDTFKINLENDTHIPMLRANTKGDELKTISFATQEIAERMP